jgi:hypothetical protein
LITQTSPSTVVANHLACLLLTDHVTQGCAGGALAGCWWHHSRRRGDCSRVLTACIQTTSLKGAQGVIWRIAMSLRARCFCFPAHTLGAGRLRGTSRSRLWLLTRRSRAQARKYRRPRFEGLGFTAVGSQTRTLENIRQPTFCFLKNVNTNRRSLV